MKAAWNVPTGALAREHLAHLCTDHWGVRAVTGVLGELGVVKTFTEMFLVVLLATSLYLTDPWQPSWRPCHAPSEPSLPSCPLEVVAMPPPGGYARGGGQCGSGSVFLG